MDKNQGLFMMALPEDTLKIVQLISRKTGMSLVDCVSAGLQALAQKHLTEQDLRSLTESKQYLTEG